MKNLTCPSCGVSVDVSPCQQVRHDYYIDGGDYGVDVRTGSCGSCGKMGVHAYYSFADRTMSWLKIDEQRLLGLDALRPFFTRSVALYVFSPGGVDEELLDAFIKKYGSDDIFFIDELHCEKRRLYYLRRKIVPLGIPQEAWNITSGLPIPNLLVENAICSQVNWGVRLFSLQAAFRGDFTRLTAENG